MKHIAQLRADRHAKIAEMRDIRTKAQGENRTMDAAESEKFDALDKKVEELRMEIEREQRVADLEKDIEKPVDDPVLDPSREKRSGEGEKSKKFDNFGEFLQSVHRASIPGGAVDKRLRTQPDYEWRSPTGMGETVPSDGGYLVNKDFSAELLRRVYDSSALPSLCRRVPVSGNGIAINAIDETSRATGSRLGGIRGYWAGEGDAGTASRPKLRRIEMPLQKLIGLCYATDELLGDASILGSVLNEGFAEEFQFLVADAIVNGDGVGKPLGFRSSPCLVTVSKESAQTADTVNTANVVKMRARLWARGRANSVWLHNQDVEPQLHQLTLGAAGSNLAVYLPGGSLANQPLDMLMGRPAIPIEQAQTVGDEGDFMLADLSQYLLIDKGGIAADMSIHVRFIYDESTFRFVYRVNGQPIWNAALTPFKGTNTVSPFISLEAR